MTDAPLQLRRNIGLPLLLFFGLGNILGAGIYVLIGKVAGEAGLYTPVAFFVASLVACLSAFSYSELSSRFPLSAGEAVYIEEGFHITALSRLTGLLIAFAGMVSAATISRGFYGYFSQFVVLPEVLVVGAIVLLLGAVTAWGIRESVSAAALLTIIEIVGLLLVIWSGSDVLFTLPDKFDTLLPTADPLAWSGILLGAFLAFFAFIGFEDMVNIAEEVKQPMRTMPAAILLALLIATVLYALVSLVSVLTLDVATLANSAAPLADVLQYSSGIGMNTISAIGMLAIVNGALIQLIMASRIFYGMASRGWLWHRLAELHPRTHTPLLATAMVTGIILVLALYIPLEDLAKTTSFLVLTVFVMVNLALFALKHRGPPPSGAIDIPRWVPLAGAVSSLSLLLVSVIIE